MCKQLVTRRWMCRPLVPQRRMCRPRVTRRRSVPPGCCVHRRCTGVHQWLLHRRCHYLVVFIEHAAAWDSRWRCQGSPSGKLRCCGHCTRGKQAAVAWWAISPASDPMRLRVLHHTIFTPTKLTLHSAGQQKEHRYHPSSCHGSHAVLPRHPHAELPFNRVIAACTGASTWATRVWPSVQRAQEV